jgi:heme/copper-type cytochrome/quinol oxidase subunit 3
MIRNTLDVSDLPDNAYDSRSPLWWGNLLMMFIETATVILILTMYYYCRRNYETWPPPKTTPLPSMVRPLPDLFWGTCNMVLLVLSCLPMYLTDMAARKQQQLRVVIGLGLMILLSGISLWIRCYEFPATHFSWGDNTYASLVWVILGLHWLYILAGALEFLVMWAWLLVHKIDPKHGLDITLAGGYWYWVAGTWLLLYFTVYFAPRLL